MGDETSAILTRSFDQNQVSTYSTASLAAAPEWWEVAYRGGPPVGPSKLIRPLYFPGGPSGKPASDDGPDVVAVKRAVWRGGRWPGPASGFNPTFTREFALGRSGDVPMTGLAGFQRQMKIQATGQMGDETYQALRYARVPDCLPNAGDPLFDARAVDLLDQAAHPPITAGIAQLLAGYCRDCIAAEPKWHYLQERPMRHLGVPPAQGASTDCSGHATSAYYWAGAPDPNHRGYDGYGYTGTLISNPQTVAPYAVGDLALYGQSTAETTHVCTCYVAGDAASSCWCSHGSETGPSSCTLHYRSDLLIVVRPGLS
jgi:hypothetical protein